MRSESVVRVVGGTMGDSAVREGIHEAARRLSHALAEVAAVLDTASDNEVLSQKAKDTLKEWGVA